MSRKPNYKEGRRYSYEGLDFYACCGMVRVVDNRDKGQGKFKDIDPVTFFERAECLFAEVKKQVYWDEKLKYIRMAEKVELACKEAVEQGNPMDPKVRQFHMRHRTYRKTVLKSGYGGAGNMMVVAENGLILPDRTLIC